ncbi:hypothetical protein WEI85_22120 [Actinomycetes bacterium KLBMP 9797]
MPLVVSLRATAPSWDAGLAWAALAVVFTAAVPYGVIWFGVRRGRLTDHHIGVREQRRRPLLYGLLSCLLGLVGLVLLGAPRQLIALILAFFVVGIAITAINQFWKLSAHAGVAACSAAVLTALFGPWLLLSYLVVAVIGWSRVRLRDHTAAQVIAGAAVGAALTHPMIKASLM